jgi:protein phosphatase
MLIGPSASGKSTFARKWFKPTEILSSDAFRGMISDDENDQTATKDAFELLHATAAKRLRRGKLVVFDATNVQPFAIENIMRMARDHFVRVVVFAFGLSLQECLSNNTMRERRVDEAVIRRHTSQYRHVMRDLRRRHKGVRNLWVFDSNATAAAATVVRNQSRHYKHFEDSGPFDIVGDVHGCSDELQDLLEKLGYEVTPEGYIHPHGRKVVFVGDYVDRGPSALAVLRMVQVMAERGHALCLPGNHDVRLVRKLQKSAPEELLKNPSKLTHGLQTTLEDLRHATPEELTRIKDWIGNLPSHLILDHGKLVVSHAGLCEEMIGRSHGVVREFCLYGSRIGEGENEDGFPIREDWAKDYRGKATIAYGHIHAGTAEFRNNTICLDTNVYMGGTLTALRYPEREIVTVPARKIYCAAAPRIEPPPPTSMPPAPGKLDGLPTTPAPLVSSPSKPGAGGRDLEGLVDIADLVEKRRVDTRLVGPVSFNRDMAAAALEQISRFAVDPRWLIYLPPTMSPCESAPEGDFLERPEEAFAYYCERQVPWVICEEKHMGSRLIAVVCRDVQTAFERFGVRSGIGACYTRLGRSFFPNADLEQGVLDSIRTAMDRAGLWEKLKTNWICLDCELMPWSAKAAGLLRRLYAGAGCAGRLALRAEASELAVAGNRRNPLQPEDQAKLVTMAGRWLDRERAMLQYVEAYRRYCWTTDGMKGLKLAPFHVMATEGRVHSDKSHLWHLRVGTVLAHGSNGLIVPTTFRPVQLAGERVFDMSVSEEDWPVEWKSQEDVGVRMTISTPEEAAAWWHKMTVRSDGAGAETADIEGMVVKPLDFMPPIDERFGRVQPALKCRGREYLRIIYGPEYTTQLEKLRKRGLGTKRRLAVQEFALGIEGLERFVKQQPLGRVHECIFAVLALECEPLDPRL